MLAYNRGSHNVRAGFDLRRMATGRRAANDPRGLFDFTGDITGYSVADFMLGLPRTVIPPTDQLQGHVGGWRNGFFVNDVWQASRNLTLNLGLRYELNTPVQTYTGLASMLAEDQETIIPSTFPSKGFKFHDPNYKDIAPRLGATYRIGEKTVVRAGFGIYYNPNQMNSFTFLTNNPPLAAVTTYTSDPANPTLSFANPTGPVGPAGRPDVISPTRDLPNARKDQWSVDVQRELGRGTALDLQYIGSNTSHLDRSFFNNTPAPGAGTVDLRRPSQKFRSRRIIQNDLIADYDAFSIILRKRMSHGLQADAHYTWSRTRDMSTHSNGGGQTMDNYDIWRDYGPANWDVPHRFVASYIYDVPFLKDSSQPVLKYVVAGWQVSGVTTIQSGSPVNITLSTDRANIGITGQQRPDLVGAVPALNCQPNSAGATDVARRQLINCFDALGVRAAGAVHLRQRVAEHAARPEVLEHRPVVHEERAGRRRRAVPGPCRDLQRLQPGELQQSERVVRCRRRSAPSPAPARCGRFSWGGRCCSESRAVFANAVRLFRGQEIGIETVSRQLLVSGLLIPLPGKRQGFEQVECHMPKEHSSKLSDRRRAGAWRSRRRRLPRRRQARRASARRCTAPAPGRSRRTVRRSTARS